MACTRFRVLASVALTVLTFGLAGCGDASPPNTGVRGAIVLIDTPDNGMTTVTLYSSGGDEAKDSTTTDATGGFKFASLPAGVYRLQAQHAGYATLIRDGILVSDSQNGEQNLGNLVLTRLYVSGQGSNIAAGNASADGKKRLFQLDDALSVYDQDTGSLSPLPTDFPFTGGLFTTDDKFLLAKVPNAQSAPTMSSSSPDLAMPSNAPVPDGGPAAIYVVPLDNGGPPWAVSYSALTAGMGPAGQNGFVLVPAASGQPGVVDLYSFTIAAAPAPPKLVASELSLADLELVRADGYTDDNFGIYSKLVFAHDPTSSPSGTLVDWSVYDLDTGVLTSLVTGVSGSFSFAPPTPSAPRVLVFEHINGGGEGATTDVYTYRIGDLAAKHVGTVDSYSVYYPPQQPGLNGPPPAAYLVDNSSSGGANLYFVSTSTGDVTSLGQFSGYVSDAILSNNGVRIDADHVWAVRLGDTAADLVQLTLSTGAVSVVQPGLSLASGGVPGTGDTLMSAGLAQIFTDPHGGTATRIVVNTMSDGSTLLPVLIDGGGPHAMPAAQPAAVWGRFSLSVDGKTLAVPDEVNGVGVMAVPAAGALPAPTRIPGSAAVGVLAAVSFDGSIVAWAMAVMSAYEFHVYTVGGADVTIGAQAFTPVTLYATKKLILAIDGGGGSQLMATSASATITSGPSFSGGGRELVATENSDRLAVYDAGSNQVFELTSGATVGVNTIAAATGLWSFPSRMRYLVPSYSGQLTIVDEDGTTDTHYGSWSLFGVDAQGAFGLERSPSGERLYVYDGYGTLLTVGATGAATQIGPTLLSDSPDSRRLLPGGEMAISGNDYDAGTQLLVTVNRDTGAVTTLSKSLVDSASFASSGPSLKPWQSPDGKTLYYFDRMAADPTAMTAATTPFFAYAPGAEPVLLGSNVQTSPLPLLSPSGDSFELRTAVDSLTGTASLAIVANGGTTANVVATKVRSTLTRPSGGARAAVILDSNTLNLASGPSEGPLTTMGVVQFFDLGGNLAWGDSRLYVIDRLTGSDTQGGTLFTGAIGQAGLTKIARGVVGAYPDKTGDQAAVVSLSADGKGLVIGRFSVSTLGM